MDPGSASRQRVALARDDIEFVVGAHSAPFIRA
jgi:hypothetical protein